VRLVLLEYRCRYNLNWSSSAALSEEDAIR